MTKVSDIIDIGETIADDATRVADRQDDGWARVGDGIPGGVWQCDKGQIGDVRSGDVLAFEWGPLTVTAVREPKPGRCPSCDSPQPSMHPAVGGGGEVTGLCPDAFHGAAPSVLLDLVRQYGDERRAEGQAVLDENQSGADIQRHEDAAGRLLDRIAALVPQQPEAPDFLAAVNKLTIERDEARSDLGESRGQARAMAATAERFHAAILRSEEERERADHDLMSALDVDRLDEVLPAIERLKAAQSDPSVLSLPQVPEGAVALIDNISGARWTRDEPGRWELAHREGFTLTLGEILQSGPVTVEFAPPREPRTWPRLDTISDDLKAVRGASGKVYHRSHFSQSVPVFRERGNDGDPLTGPGHMFYALQTFDGPLTEVFEDEPGGEPR